MEARIQQAQLQMVPYRSILEDATTIEADHSRQEVLAQAVSLLKHLNAALDTWTHYQTELDKAEKNHTEAGLALLQRQTAVGQAQAAVDAVLAQQEELHNTLATLQTQSRVQREKLEHRQALTGEEICPTCGSALDNEEVQARLASERERWYTASLQPGPPDRHISWRLELAKETLSDAKRTYLTEEGETRTADNNLTALRVEAKHAAQALERAQETYDLACRAAGEWAEELERLDELETELEDLKESSRWVVLQEAQQVETQVTTVITAHRHSLDELPQWTGEERERGRTDLGQVSAMIDEYQEQAESFRH